MSTTGSTTNCVFNTIAEIGDPNIGSPFIDIVDTVQANILNKNILPQPRNIESHTLRAIQYGLQAGIITEPQKGCFKIVEAPRNPETIADEDDADAVRSVEYNDGSHNDRYDNDKDSDKDAEYSENEKRLNEHQFFSDDGQSSNTEDQSERENDDHSSISSSDDENEADGDSENLGDDDDNVATPDNVENDRNSHHCCGGKNGGRDDNVNDNNKARSIRDGRSSRSNDRCGPKMNCEPTQPCRPKRPNNPCPPSNPKSPCEPKKPCGPWSPYAPKNPKSPIEPERPKNPQPPTRCVCRPRKCQPKCRRPEPEHFGSHKDEHFEENDSDDFDNSVKSYEVDDFKGDFKENNQNESELKQTGRPSCGPPCRPSCGGSRNDSMNGIKRRQSESNDDLTSKKRHRASIPKEKINTACSILFENDLMREINRTQGYYPTQPYYYRKNIDSANYQKETTENPYYKDHVLNTGKKSHQKRNKEKKGSFSPSQIPACPIGPTDPQGPSSPGEPRPPLEPPPYTGGTVKSSRDQKQKDNKNDLFNQIARNSPDADGKELDDYDHDCDFQGDSDDFDNDICSDEFNDFEDDAGENVDEGQADGNDDEDDDDEDQDSDDEENPGNYDGLKDQQLRQAKSEKPDKKQGREDRHGNKRHHNRSDSSSSCSTGSEGHCKNKHKHQRKHFHDQNKCNTMALGPPSHNILKRNDRGVDFLKKRLQIAASRLSQSTEDCCRGSRV